ncbi:MAG: DUF5667 domain-containing protein [Candidatus Taylorbacteria bacterium]|nr:DUF5667 domain-containing protein [Candidatus Taylorbacteria bacterium]
MKTRFIIILLLFIPVLAFILSPVEGFAQAGLPAEATRSGAKAGLTPENPFYFLDAFVETLQEFFTFNSENKARLQITLATERVAEIKVILETKGIEAKGLMIAQTRLQKHLGNAAKIVTKQKDDGKDVGKITKEINDVNKEVEKLEKEKEKQKELRKFKEEQVKKNKRDISDRQEVKEENGQMLKSQKIIEKAPQHRDVRPKPQKTDIINPSNISSGKQQFDILEKELMGAQAGGSYLSPEHSSRIQNDLTNLENQNYDMAEIKRLRAIVLKLSPHLQDQLNSKSENTSTSTQSSPSSNNVSSPALIGSTADNKPSGKPLVIKNLGVSFEPWDKNTNRAGAFLFLQSENKLFLEYGIEVQGSDGNTKVLPTFEYRTAKDADVFAVSDGIITKIEYQQQTQDYEILIQPEANSEWTLGHDHVSNIRVSEGDNIKAGDILGKAGTLGGELGRTEIMVWGGPSSSNRPLTHCPFKLFAPELLAEYQQKVSRHMKDWEEFKGNPDLYAEGKHTFAGCLRETILD